MADRDPLAGDNPARSPALLPRLPKRGVGVRRLNRVPLVIACGGAALAGGAIIWTVHVKQQQHTASTSQQAEAKPSAGTASVLNGAPRGEIKEAGSYTPVSKPTATQPASAAAASTTQPHDQTGAGGEGELASEARKHAWEVYFQEVAELQRARLEAAQQAVHADTSPSGAAGGGATAPGSGGQLPQPGQLQGQPAMVSGGAQPGYAPGGYGSAGLLVPAGLGGLGGSGGLPIYPPAGPDPSGAREKQAFTNQAGNLGQNDTLASTVRDPISPYLVTAGDSIPCVAVTGENSDAPGQFVGRVSRNVYDSATGNYLLIPQGSKVVGDYDNVVTAGQSRIPTIITRIIFPDSSSIPIGAMPAADQSGFAGLHDQVDHHLWEKFGNALILAVGSAGIQLSQGTGQSTNGYSAQQIGAAAIGQQFGELGQEFARSGLSIPNTLSIRNRYPFVVQITKDIVLRPYVDRRSSRGVLVDLGPVPQ